MPACQAAVICSDGSLDTHSHYNIAQPPDKQAMFCMRNKKQTSTLTLEATVGSSVPSDKTDVYITANSTPNACMHA